MAQPAYRIPPNLDGKADPAVVKAIQHLDRTVNQHEIAFSQLTPATTSSTTSAASSSPTVSAGVTASQASGIAVQAIQSTLGQVNAQTGTAYTTLNSDYGAIVTLDNASPVAVTLGGDGTGVQAQWWSFIQNNGAGTATLTPASGTINGAASITLITGQSVATFFDGTNWWAATSIPGSGGTITAVVAGTGLTGGGSSGSVTLAIATTAVTAGSYTNANITVNAEGQLTAAANGSSSGLPVNNPTFTGLMTGPQYASNGSTPGIAAGAASGTSPTIAISGNDSGGSIGITPGIGATTGTLATVTWATAYPNGCFVVVQPLGTGTFINVYAAVGTTTGFDLDTSTSLTPATPYVFIYIVSGY